MLAINGNHRKAKESAFKRARIAVFVILVLSSFLVSLQGDEIEFLKGDKLEGTVIKETGIIIVFEVNNDEYTMKMDIPKKRIHAVTINGKRRIINEKSAAILTKHVTTKEQNKKKNNNDQSLMPPKELKRSRSEVENLIKQAGENLPDWWESVRLNYPDTLDLTWKLVARGWQPKKNLGAYIFEAKKNLKKWKGAVKLLHYTLEVNMGNKRKEKRSMNELGYFLGILLEDYARGAYWWRRGGGNKIGLATCYWKLGNKNMAENAIKKYSRDNTLTGRFVKLWAEMGDLKKALTLAKGRANSGKPDIGYLAAGNACRFHGKYRKALEYYQKVLDAGKGSRQIKKNKERAAAAIEALKGMVTFDLSRIPNGTYSASSIGFRGEVHVEVSVKHARIESVKIKNNKEDMPANSLIYIPMKIVEMQSIKGVDAVSGATLTSNAIIHATTKALSKAQ